MVSSKSPHDTAAASLAPTKSLKKRRNRLQKPRPTLTSGFSRKPCKISCQSRFSDSTISSISPAPVPRLLNCGFFIKRKPVARATDRAEDLSSLNASFPSKIHRPSPLSRPYQTPADETDIMIPAILSRLSPSKQQPTYIPWSQRQPQTREQVRVAPDLKFSPAYEVQHIKGPEPIKCTTLPQVTTSHFYSSQASDSMKAQPSRRASSCQCSNKSCAYPKQKQRTSFWPLKLLPKSQKRAHQTQRRQHEEKPLPWPRNVPIERPPRPQRALFDIEEDPPGQTPVQRKPSPETEEASSGFDACSNLPTDIPHPTDSNPSLESYGTSSSSELAKQQSFDQSSYGPDVYGEEAARIARHRCRAFHALDGNTRRRTKRLTDSEKRLANRAGILQPQTSTRSVHRAGVSPAASEKDLMGFAERAKGESKGWSSKLKTGLSKLSAVPEEKECISPPMGQKPVDLRGLPRQRRGSPPPTRQIVDASPETTNLLPKNPVTQVDGEWRKMKMSPISMKPLPVLPSAEKFPQRSSSLDQPRFVRKAILPPSRVPPSSLQPCRNSDDHDKVLAFAKLIDEETKRRKQRDDELGEAESRHYRIQHHRHRIENGRSQLSSPLVAERNQLSPDVAKPDHSQIHPSESSQSLSDGPVLATKTTHNESNVTPVEPMTTVQEHEAFENGKQRVRDASTSEYAKKGKYRFSSWEKENEKFARRKKDAFVDASRTQARQERSKSPENRDSDKISVTENGTIDSSTTPSIDLAAFKPPPLRIPSRSNKRPPPPLPELSSLTYSPPNVAEVHPQKPEILPQNPFADDSPTVLSFAHGLRRSLSNDSLATWSASKSASLYSQASDLSHSGSSPSQPTDPNLYKLDKTHDHPNTEGDSNVLPDISVPHSIQDQWEQRRQQQDDFEDEILSLYTDEIPISSRPLSSEIGPESAIAKLDELLLETERVHRDVRMSSETEQERLDREWEEIIREKVRKIDSALKIKRKPGAFEIGESSGNKNRVSSARELQLRMLM